MSTLLVCLCCLLLLDLVSPVVLCVRGRAGPFVAIGLAIVLDFVVVAVVVRLRSSP